VPDQSLSTTEKLALEFDVLSDADNSVARLFGLVYRISDTARERRQALGRDLVAHNGIDRWELVAALDRHAWREGSTGR
jgi:hypothetical protein